MSDRAEGWPGRSKGPGGHGRAEAAGRSGLCLRRGLGGASGLTRRIGDERIGVGVGRGQFRFGGGVERHVRSRHTGTQSGQGDVLWFTSGMPLCAASGAICRPTGPRGADTRCLVPRHLPGQDVDDLQRCPHLDRLSSARTPSGRGGRRLGAGGAGRARADPSCSDHRDESCGIQCRQPRHLVVGRSGRVASLQCHCQCRSGERHGGGNSRNRVVVHGRWPPRRMQRSRDSLGVG